MPESNYVAPIMLRGDMLAQFNGNPHQIGNPGDANFGMRLNNVEALGSSSDQYRLVWHQNVNSSATTFANGQGWRLEQYTPGADPDGDPTTGNGGWTTVPGMTFLTPKNDVVSGLGAGDDYIVFDGGGKSLLLDIRGNLPSTPTTLVYSGVDENGDPLVGNNDGELGFGDGYSSAVCFAAGTLIETEHGKRAVETLKRGDKVITRSSGALPIEWTGRRILSGQDLAASPRLAPIRITAGALGPGIPSSDLIVSPQHRVLLRSHIAGRLFGSNEVLVPAVKLLGLPGISREPLENGADYLHFMLERHEIVQSNGAPTESFYPGKQAMRMIGAEARKELLSLFPELAAKIPGQRLQPTRPIVEGKQANRLVSLHRRQRSALYAS